MGSYIDSEIRNPLGAQYQRSGKFPIDRSSIFDSYDDACKYALGKRTTKDKRGLYASSYVGQIITVYENGVVSIYKIEEDRTLTRIDDNFVKIIDVNGVEYIPTTAGTVNLTVVASGIGTNEKMLSVDNGLLKSTLSVDIHDTTDNKRELRLKGKDSEVIATCDITNIIKEYVLKTEYNPITNTITIKHVGNVGSVDYTNIIFDTTQFSATTGTSEATTSVTYSIKGEVFASYSEVEEIKQTIEVIKSQLTNKIDNDYYTAGSGITISNDYVDDNSKHHKTIINTGVDCGTY